MNHKNEHPVIDHVEFPGSSDNPQAGEQNWTDEEEKLLRYDLTFLGATCTQMLQTKDRSPAVPYALCHLRSFIVRPDEHFFRLYRWNGRESAA